MEYVKEKGENIFNPKEIFNSCFVFIVLAF